MMRFCYLLLLLTLFSCQKNTGSSDNGDTNNTILSQSQQPWVFRSVLDLKPRMLTMALHDDFMVAYDTEQAAFYKAWKGYVDFDGAVYTTAHGPQPTSIGDAYVINQYPEPWYLVKNGKEIIPDVHYKGHRIKDDQVTLTTELLWGDGNKITIHEQPEYAATDKLPGLKRTFTTKGVPEGIQVGLKTNFNSIAFKSKISTDGTLTTGEEKAIKRNKYNGIAI